MHAVETEGGKNNCRQFSANRSTETSWIWTEGEGAYTARMRAQITVSDIVSVYPHTMETLIYMELPVLHGKTMGETSMLSCGWERKVKR